MKSKKDFVDSLPHFGTRSSLNPPMKNVVGETYAETRAELETREKAEIERRAAKLAEKEIASLPPQKSSVWFAVLTIIFLIIALAGVGFGVYEYFENEKLRDEIINLQNN